MSVFEQRWVHLDMKGAPPRPGYLREVFPLLKQWGATGLCIEWEDMLPFGGRIEGVRHPRAYTPRQVAGILEDAARAGLEVVPLVQTFGHMEFVLKHKRFEAMREDPDSAHDLCPLHPEAAGLARELVEQTLALHPNARAIHLGGDEVWSLGQHPETARAVAARGKAAVYREHVQPLVDLVAARGLRALLWDDMLREWPVGALRPLAGKAELVVWRYGAEIEAGLPSGMWDRFREAGLTLWGASAFKGACGDDAMWTGGEGRARNHAAWVDCAREHAFAGLILTGWSRYSHFGPLCETLPVGLPHLALSLAILDREGFDDALRRETFEAIGIGDMPFTHRRTEDIVALPTGHFPGAEAFRLIGKLQGARQLMWFAHFDLQNRWHRRNGGRVNDGAARVVLRRAEWAERLAGEVAAELPAALRKILFPEDVREFMAVQVRALIAASRRAQREAERVTARVFGGRPR